MSTTLSIIGVFLALAILIVGSLKGAKLFPLTIIGVLVVALTNNIGIWECFSSVYIKGMQSAVASFFILICSATVYSQTMNRTGSTNAIAYWCIRTFGKKNSVLVLMMITGLLGIAGLNGMMMVFAVYGIISIIMKEANLPRKFAAAFVFFGCGLFAEGYFPASVHLNNVLPTQFLGTNLLAAPVLGLATGIVAMVLGYLYMQHATKNAVAAGEGWTEPTSSLYVISGPTFTEETAPSAIKAFLPMIVMIALVLILSITGVPSGAVAAVSMLSSALVCALLNTKTLSASDTKLFGFLQDCFDQTWKSCGPLVALLAFGNVISTSEGFQAILTWLVSLDVSTYVKGALCTGALSAATGSSAAGIKLTGQYLGDYFLSSGANIGTLHRIIAMSATVFCEVPQCSAIYLILGMFGISYKDGYKHIFALMFGAGLIALLLGLGAVLVLGL